MIIGNRFEIIKQIVKNKFYIAQNIFSEEMVFVKIQRIDEYDNFNILKNEAIIYANINGTLGFPKLKYYGSDNINNYLILTLLNKNLFEIKGKLNLKQILHIGTQIINRIEYIHSLNIIHRDIKPHNFMIPFNNDNIYDFLNKDLIHLIDFGFSKKYIDENNKHIPLKTGKEIIGTPNFASINVLNGIEPSRRDDLESGIYVCLYLYLDNDTWDYITEKETSNKKDLKILNLYENLQIPKIFIDLLNYIYSLKFDEIPDYNFLKSLINTFTCSKN